MVSPPPNAPDSSGSACPHCGEHHPAAYTHCPKTGKAMTVGRALIGRVIAGRYKIIGLLGEGGMGAVYVAENMLIGRKVAIKRLHPELAADEKAVQRFQREARAAAATGHEHIVEILDLGYAEDGAPYLVMEYLRGQSLAALLRKDGKLDSRRACGIVGQVLAALASVHAQQIVHRDLKPDNVFLIRQNNTEWVKILDFGISKMKREEGEQLDLTRTGVMLGTPFYMSPEQARGMKNLDIRVDLYAAGVILYECLSGRVPFDGDNYHQLLQLILRNEPPPLRSLVPNVDPALESIVLKAIAKDPAGRYPDAESMLNALVPFGAANTIREPSAAPAPATPLATTGLEVPLDQEPREGERTPERPFNAPPMAAQPSLGDSQELRARRTPPTNPRFEAIDRRPPNRAATPPRLSSMTPSAGTAPTAFAPSPATPVASVGPRYFYVESDDWDDAKSRAAIEASNRGANAFRDIPSGTRDAAPVRDFQPPRDYSAPPRDYANRSDQTPVSIREPIVGYGATLPPAESAGRSIVAVTGSETEVKGSLFVAALEYIETVHGRAGMEQLFTQLDEQARERLTGVILPMAWVPITLYDQLLRAVERTIGTGEGATAAAIGRATADKELPTTHRLFMQTASPSVAAERIPQMYRLYHARAELRASPTPGGGVRIELETSVPETLYYCWSIAGFWQRMLELTGGRDVRAAVVSCRSRGDERTAIALRWR